MPKYVAYTFAVAANSGPVKQRFVLPKTTRVSAYRVSSDLQALGASYSAAIARYRFLFNNRVTGLTDLLRRDWNLSRGMNLMQSDEPIESVPFEFFYEPLSASLAAHTVTIILEIDV